MKQSSINKIILPRYVFSGSRTIKELSNVLDYLGIIKGTLLVVSGSSRTKEISLDIVKPIIEREGMISEQMEINSVNKFLDELPEYLHKVKDLDVKMIIGVGGGKIIDATKIIALITNKRFISIPTNASHDGLSSPVISFLLALHLESKYNIKPIMKAPVAIIADIELIMKSPPKSLIAGVGDLIAKKTAVKDWQLANMLKGEEYSEYASSMALMSTKLIEKNIDTIAKFDEKAFSIVLKALIGSGIAISVAGSSRPASGSEHLFSHALDILAEKEGFMNEMHGIQCGLGTIIMSQLHGMNYRKIRDILKKVKAPTTAKEINIDKKFLIKALMMSNKIRKDRYTILGDIDITYNTAEKLLKRVEII